MESTSQNIKFIYFTKSIEYYTYLLDIGNYSIVITSTGLVYGTGDNTYGQLGINSTVNQNSLTPMVSMPSGKTAAAIACGQFHTIVLMTDGTVYGTGYNNFGQLGINITATQTILTLMVSMPSGKTPAAIACGASYTIVLMTDGTVYGTGQNNYGQLGINSTANQKGLTLMISMPSGKTPIAISCGNSHTIVLMHDGTVYGTGYNSFGQLGINSSIVNTLGLTIMTPMPSGKTPIAITCGNSHTMVLMNDGTVYGTGQNTYGQLGITNNIVNQLSLTIMSSIPLGKTPIAIECGLSHTMVLMSDRTIYGTGYNYFGQLGVGNNTTTQYTSLQSMIMPSMPSNKIPISITCGQYHTIVLMNDGTVYGTGANVDGQLGTTNNTNTSSLVQMLPSNLIISELMDAIPMSNVCFIKGTLIMCDYPFNEISIEQIDPTIHQVFLMEKK